MTVELQRRRRRRIDFGKLAHVAEKTFYVRDIVLDTSFPAKLKELLSGPARALAARWVDDLRDTAQDEATQAQHEAIIAQAEPWLGTTFWQRWQVTGVDGVKEENSPLSPVQEIPTDSLDLFRGASTCWLILDAWTNRQGNSPNLSVSAHINGGVAALTVEAPREMLPELIGDLESLMKPYTFPPVEPTPVPQPPFKVFVAYGGGRAWEVVRDYLRAEGFQVEAFTEEERAGQLTLDVVEEMIRTAAVAIIVMTGADRMASGDIHARQNVVHEAGFAQGAIGRRNTVILREAGVTLPTNVDGLTYIQFEVGEIHTTRDRVVALVSRLRTQTLPNR